ncbi:OFA family MFS transporter [Clostridium sp. CM027]|uniref:L-lactate MFS transporter n=1 Tax=Clostridium sp. CM027 TaxID=2849865 RepID=UPI001C6EC173|nr:OFA family MFS transporter [Clostridium sp. CM027]MBW9145999.1 OFA family MFS transporter [Clostridium sp. CM027]UVE39469.1 OFA family MFS transporter [Clostridium sp. CM027]
MKFKQRWIYVILGIIIMMCLGTVYSWSVFRIPIEKAFNIGSTQSGFPYMVSLAAYSFFMFITGKYLEKYSPRMVISMGALLVALGWILSAYAPNIYILTITYGVIIGAGVGIAYGAPMTVVAKWFPEKKGLVVGIVLIGFGLSPLITAPLARNLIESYGITKAFLILGVSFGVIIPLLSYPFRYPSDVESKSLETTASTKIHMNGTNTAKMIKSKNFKGLYVNFMIGSMIGLMLIGMTSNVGVELIKLSPKTVALLMIVFAVFNGIGRPIFGLITDKYSSKTAMLISYALIIIAALLMLVANEGSLVLFSIAFSIFWFNLGGWLAIAPTSTLDMYGTKHYSENYGVVFTAYGIGAIIGVLASGLLMDILANYNYIFYFIIGLCIMGILSSKRMIKT